MFNFENLLFHKKASGTIQSRFQAAVDELHVIHEDVEKAKSGALTVIQKLTAEVADIEQVTSRIKQMI